MKGNYNFTMETFKYVQSNSNKIMLYLKYKLKSNQLNFVVYFFRRFSSL